MLLYENSFKNINKFKPENFNLVRISYFITLSMDLLHRRVCECEKEKIIYTCHRNRGTYKE